MPSLIFRGAYLRHFTVQDDEGGVFTRAHFTANFSKPICDALGWEEFSDHVKSAKLEGELRATNLTLTPNGQLAKHKLEFECTEVGNFEFKRSGDGETQLDFVVRSSSEGVPSWLENHKRRIGAGEGQLRLAYEKQGDLPLGDAEPESAEPEVADAPGSLARKASMAKSGVQ